MHRDLQSITAKIHCDCKLIESKHENLYTSLENGP